MKICRVKVVSLERIKLIASLRRLIKKKGEKTHITNIRN